MRTLAERASRAQRARRNRLTQQQQPQALERQPATQIQRDWSPVRSKQSMPDNFNPYTSDIKKMDPTVVVMDEEPQIAAIKAKTTKTKTTKTKTKKTAVPRPVTPNASRFIDADMMDAPAEKKPLDELHHSQNKQQEQQQYHHQQQHHQQQQQQEDMLLEHTSEDIPNIPDISYRPDRHYHHQHNNETHRQPRPVSPFSNKEKVQIDVHMVDQPSKISPSSGSKTVSTTESSTISPHGLDWENKLIDKSISMPADDIAAAAASDDFASSPPPPPPPPPPPMDASNHTDDGGHRHLMPVVSPDSKGESLSISKKTLDKITAAFRQGHKPTALSKEEESIWDCLNQVIQNKRNDYMTKKRILERKLQETSAEVELNKAEKDETKLKLQSIEEELHKTREASFKQTEAARRTQTEARDATRKAKVLQREHFDKKREFEKTIQEQKEEHEAALLAIQRVLADVTSEKDTIKEGLETQLKKLKDKNVELLVKKKKDNTMHDQLMRMQKAKKDIQLELTKKTDELTKLQTSEFAKSEELQTSLENAKLLISSLESSSGKMALDHRMKVKQKDAEIYKLRADLASQRKKLDRLALDFKELQNEKTSSKKKTKTKNEQPTVLTPYVEKAIAELEALATKPVEEETTDRISTTICNTLVALKIAVTGAITENRDDDAMSTVSGTTEFSISETSVGGVDQKALERHLDAIIQNDRESAAKDLRQQLEKKATLLSNLEEKLKEQKKENELMTAQNQLLLQAKERSERKCEDQIRKLKEEQTHNIQALAKKQQELRVLRDSLTLGEGLGYISGDDSDDDDQSPGDNPLSPAIQTLTHLSFVANGVEISAVPNASEIEAMRQRVVRIEEEKEKAMRDLQEEKESLSNAKMIISSLEKANKTMLEDLRSRLQDSNTAIASLLDKSMENEKMSKDLKQELEKLKKEKREAEEKYQEEMSRTKDEAMVAGLRLAAKDKEIQALRMTAGIESTRPEEEKEEKTCDY